MFLKKRHKREIINLNVIPLIDISSMIIIFLLMGAIFGETSIDVPLWVNVPKSENNENIESAPRVIISKDTVQISFLGEKKMQIDAFRPDNLNSASLLTTIDETKKFISKIPNQSRQAGVLLNLVADETANYRDIFDVIAVFRKAGFESVLFVAMGK